MIGACTKSGSMPMGTMKMPGRKSSFRKVWTPLGKAGRSASCINQGMRWKGGIEKKVGKVG